MNERDRIRKAERIDRFVDIAVLGLLVFAGAYLLFHLVLAIQAGRL